MRRIFFVIAIIGTLTAGFIACNNGDYLAEPQNSLPPGGLQAKDCPGLTVKPISAKIRDTDFVATGSSSGVIIYDTLPKFDDKRKVYFVLNASNNNFQGSATFLRIVAEFRGLGEYYLFQGPQKNSATFFTDKLEDGFSTSIKGDGRLEITRFDDSIGGNFFFEAQNNGGDKLKVCGGYFLTERIIVE